MDLPVITLSPYDSNEIIIVDDQGLELDEATSSTMLTQPCSFVVDCDYLRKIGEKLASYRSDVLNSREIPDIAYQLEEWSINIEKFHEEQNDLEDNILALMHQNIAMILELKWHLIEGKCDGTKSIDLGRLVLTSSLNATSKWLKVEDFENAKVCHEISSKFVEYLEDSDEFMFEMSSQERFKVRQEQLVFLTNSIEILYAQGYVKGAKYYIKMVTAKLESPVTTRYLATLLYNFAIDAREKKDFAQSLEWLKESMEICGEISTDLKFKISYLMGTVYLEMDRKNAWKNAGLAYESAFTLKPDSTLLLNMTRCVLYSGKTMLVKEFLEYTLIPNKNFLKSMDAENIVNLLLESDHSALAYQLLSNPNMEHLFTIQLKACTFLKMGRVKEAEKYLEVCEDYEPDEDFVQEILKQTVTILTSSKLTDIEKRFKWLRFASNATSKIAKQDTNIRYEEISNLLLKQICFFQVSNGAEIEAKKTWKSIPDDELNPFYSYLKMRMLLMEGKNDQFVEMLLQLADTAMSLHYEGSSAITMACSAALSSECNNHRVLETCLKKLLSNTSLKTVVKVHVHKYLVHLLLEKDEIKLPEILKLLEEGREIIIEATREDGIDHNKVVIFYLQTFWNIVLSLKPTESGEVLLGCCQLLKVADIRVPEILICCKTIFLQAIKIFFHFIRIEKDLEKIKIAVALCEELKFINANQNEEFINKFIFLHEFEINCILEQYEILENMWDYSRNQIDFCMCKRLLGILIEREIKNNLKIKIGFETLRKGLERESEIDSEENWDFVHYQLKTILSQKMCEDMIYSNITQLVEIISKMTDESQLYSIASQIWNRGVAHLTYDNKIYDKYFTLTLKLARQNFNNLSKNPDSLMAKFEELYKESQTLKLQLSSLGFA